jgi:hypothetical protein
MKAGTRKMIRLGPPLLVAVLYAAQTLLDYLKTGQLSLLYIGGIVVFLTVFGVFWYIERKNS